MRTRRNKARPGLAPLSLYAAGEARRETRRCPRCKGAQRGQRLVRSTRAYGGFWPGAERGV